MVPQILMNKTVKKGRNNMTIQIANKIYCALWKVRKFVVKVFNEILKILEKN